MDLSNQKDIENGNYLKDGCLNTRTETCIEKKDENLDFHCELNVNAEPFIPNKKENNEDFSEKKYQYFSEIQRVYEQEGSSEDLDYILSTSEETKSNSSSDELNDENSNECKNIKNKERKEIFYSEDDKQKAVISFTNKIKNFSGNSYFKFKNLMNEFDNLITSGAKLDQMLFSTIFKACSNFGYTGIDLANEIWNKMIELNISPNTIVINAIMNVHASQGNVQETESYLKEMESFNILPDINSYNTLIYACSELEDFEKAQFWFKKILEKGLKPDVYTYNTIIITASRDKVYDKGFEYFEIMKKENVEPNVQTLTSMLKICSQTTNFEKAVKLIEFARKTEIVADICMWNSFFQVCLKCGKINEILMYWEDLKKTKSPDVSTINCLLEASGRLNDTKKLVEILMYTKKKNIMLNSYTFTSIINGCVDSMSYNDSIQWFFCLKDAFPWNNVLISNLFRILERDVDWTKRLNSHEKKLCSNFFKLYGLPPNEADRPVVQKDSKNDYAKMEYKIVMLNIFQEAMSRGIFKENFLNQNFFVISLINLSNVVADVLLTYTFGVIMNKYLNKKPLQKLEIVTGKRKIRELCEKYLRERRIHFNKNPSNAGRITIYPEKLRWFMRFASKKPVCLL